MNFMSSSTLTVRAFYFRKQSITCYKYYHSATVGEECTYYTPTVTESC